jgi:hypothetical protein
MIDENLMDEVFTAMVAYEDQFRNDYLIRGDVTNIRITRLDGEFYDVLIDTADLERVRSRGTWFVKEFNKYGHYYVFGNTKVNNKRHTELLHRFIMKEPEGLVIDHINHDTLDNRKENLRAVTFLENLRNRKDKK